MGHSNTVTPLPNGNVGATSSVSSSTTGGCGKECAGCGKKIIERFLLKALDLYWHEDCLKCGCCDCRLGEVGKTLYTRANLILCKRDYLRLFGSTGFCAACNKGIPAFELVMRAKRNVYHLECFACQQCNYRFCVGDRFHLCDNKILCEYDYEERLVFASMANSSSTNLGHIRGQISPPNTATGIPNNSVQQQHHQSNKQTLSGSSSSSSSTQDVKDVQVAVDLYMDSSFPKEHGSMKGVASLPNVVVH